MSDSKHNSSPDNLLGKLDKGTEKKEKLQAIPLDLERYVVAPKPVKQGENIIVPFEAVIRVQKDYFYEYKDELVAMNKEVVATDYGREAPKKVRKYLKFVNFPEHKNYRKEIDVNYNLYRPLSYTPKKGDWLHIEKMLRHLFRGKHYEMILTYFWVLYNEPTHQLPLIGLVSQAKGTGKTKFIQLVKAIFGGNAKTIDAEDLTDSFNDYIMDKLCILIDENISSSKMANNAQDTNKLQKLKKLITGGTQTRKAKYQSAIDTEFYGKFIMCSNDIQNMLSLEKENTRFWVIDVPKLESEDMDILKKAIPEIPAFLHYLENEYQPMPRLSRLWFSPDQIQTERGQKMQENSRSEVAMEVVERLTDYFVERESQSEIHFSSAHFLAAFPIPYITAIKFSKIVKAEFIKETEIMEVKNPFTGGIIDDRCRCFTFHREEIIQDVSAAQTEDGTERTDDAPFYDFDSIE